MKIKHIVALLGGASALFTLPVSSSFAADTSVNASVMNTEFQTEQDSDFTTTLYIPENSNISDFQAVIDYDEECVSLVKATPCESESGSIAVNEKNGKLYISYSSVKNQTAQIDVVDLTFHVTDDLAGGKYDFITIDTSGKNIASSNTASGDSTEHKLSPIFTTLDIYQYGDADLDGDINSRDITYVKQVVVGEREISDISRKYSNAYMDFEEDGVTPKISTRDAALIQQKVVKMDVNLGDRSTITFYDKDGEIYTEKSIKSETALSNIPSVPDIKGYGEAHWSLSPDELIEVDFAKISKDTEIYAYYGEASPIIEKYNAVVEALDEGFAQSGKYIVDDFQLPYKSNYGSFNMLSSSEFNGLDIIWTIDSGLLAQSVNISKDYVVDVPELDYTTWVTFTANIYFDGVKYGTHDFKREIKGIIDIPSPTVFKNVLKQVPSEIDEHYRLPGYISLEDERGNYGVSTVQNVDIQWSVVKNSDGSTADKRVFDTTNNEIIYLKDENNVTLQADFVFDGNVVYTDRISRTIPAKSIDGQIEYAKKYIQSYVPSIISGETYFPTTVPLYDLTVSWIPDIESGKVEIGANETVNGVTYKIIDVGEKAGYMEWAKAYANIGRNGDKTFTQTGLEFDVQLAGNSSEISTDKIPDVNLYNALKNIFDKKYGNNDGILTEEEIYSTETMEKLNYSIELCYKNIENLNGIKYLKNYRSICLSGNNIKYGLEEIGCFKYLEHLSLSNCDLTEIPKEVFSSKCIIEGVDLSYNNLKNVDFLQPCGYNQYIELKELFLQGNYITDISGFSFINEEDGKEYSRIPNINVLTLSRDLNYFEFNKNSSEHEGIIKDYSECEYDISAPLDLTPIKYMTHLTTLWLANNNILDISPLESCTLLSTLDLSNNAIESTVKNDTLAPLSKLQSLVCLKLDNNNISNVSSLKRLIYLEILSISNNNIGSMTGIADNLHNLVYLDLDNNKLTTFDAGYFPKLERLYLEHQYRYDENDNSESIEVRTLIQVLNLDMATNLVELRLNNNSVDRSTIESIAALTKLDYLSLSGNTIENLDFLENLTSLTHLELAACKIKQEKTISTTNTTTGETTNNTVDNMSYIGNLKKLLLLDISTNKDIHDISKLSGLNKLVILYANNLKMESASELRYMTKLEYLSIQNSGLNDLSFLNTLNALKFLNISGHSAEKFDFRNLENCNNIQALFMDSNCKTKVTNLNTFVNKQHLQYMSLANMDIGSIDTLPDMDNVIYLGLRNTNISDFNGTYSEDNGYIYPITRFSTLKYIDVADNPNLFTKNNLEMLYDFVGEKDNEKSIILYRDNAPEGYVPGVMNPDIEAVTLKNYVDFGTGSENILEAMSAGYPLQETLNGYDIDWQIEENDIYYVKDGKLYFHNTDESDASAKLSLTMAINGLYYRPENTNTKKSTPVSFTASIQTTSESRPTGEKKFVKTDYTTSSEKTLDGWILDSTEYGEIKWGDWSGWSTNGITENELRQVETKTEESWGNWGGWSNWTTDYIAGSDSRNVETKQEPYSYSTNHYFSACSSSYKSIQDALISIGADGSYANRKNIAAINGISNYSGSQSQNVQMLDLLKAGQLIEWVENCTGYTTYYRYCDRSKVYTTYYRYRDGVRIPTVYYFHKDVYEDVYEDVISGMTLVVE